MKLPDTTVVTGEPSEPVADAGTTRVWPRAWIFPSMARAFKETLEPGDTEDVVGQSDASHGFSRYAFHDIEPVTMTEAVVIVVTDSSGIPVRDFVHPQYLAAVLASTSSDMPK